MKKKKKIEKVPYLLHFSYNFTRYVLNIESRA